MRKKKPPSKWQLAECASKAEYITALDGHKHRNDVRIRNRAYRAIRELARRHGRSITQEIEEAIRSWCEVHGQECPLEK